MRYRLGIACVILLLLAACAANRPLLTEQPLQDRSKPTYLSVYYFITGMIMQSQGNYDLADQLLRKAQDNDPNSYQIQKQVLLNSHYLYYERLLDEKQLKDIIASYARRISFDEEILNSNYSFFEGVQDSLALAQTMHLLVTNYPSAQTYIQRFIYGYKHLNEPDIRYLDLAFELAQNSPLQLRFLSRFYFILGQQKAHAAAQRLLEISPDPESHEMMAELILSSKDQDAAQAYFASLSYPADFSYMSQFLTMAYHARQPEIILALGQPILQTLDVDLLYLLGFSALTNNRPDLLREIERALPLSLDPEQSKESLYAMLIAGSLSGEEERLLDDLADKISSSYGFGEIYTFYNIASAALLPDSEARQVSEFQADFISQVKLRFSDSAPVRYLEALATAIGDSTFSGYEAARYALVDQLWRQGKHSEDDLEFLVNYMFNNGMLEERRAVLVSALSLYPDNPGFLNDLGYSLLIEGVDPDQAAKLIFRALDFEPDNPYFLDSIAWYYYLIGDYQMALYYVEIPKQMEDMPAEIAYHIGAIYLELKDFDLAKHYLYLSISIGEDAEHVVRARQALQRIP